MANFTRFYFTLKKKSSQGGLEFVRIKMSCLTCVRICEICDSWNIPRDRLILLAVLEAEAISSV